jgi:hypothetical protein
MTKNLMLKQEIIDWLLSSNPWTEYRTRMVLLGQSDDNSEVIAARSNLISHPLVIGLLHEIQDWPGETITNHKNAGLLIHKLVFLADLGLNKTDEGIQSIQSSIFSHISPEGPLQIRINIPTHFGGSGQDGWGWVLCDTPSLTYALASFGMKDDPRIISAVDHLAGLIRRNGFPCACSPEFGRFHGPGRKDDPCPIVNLIMLKLLAQYPARLNSPEILTTTETLLDLWEHSQEQHPYLFKMGNDFRKLKAPFIWYDLLHVLDVLTQIPAARSDPRLLDMLKVMTSQADMNGKFTPTSVWTVWKDWDFGQKKEPSPWLTFLAWRIIQRMKAA